MKFIDTIIADIPNLPIMEWGKDNELKYYINTKELLEELKPYEVEIPKEYYDKWEQENKDKYWGVYGNGVLQYLTDLTRESEDKWGCGDNTYNHGGHILNDFCWQSVEHNGKYYVALMVHRGGDIRANYTYYCLLEFEYDTEFYEVVEDICCNISSGGFIKEYKGKQYSIEPRVFSEYLSVYCYDNGEQYEFYASCDEDLEKEFEENVKE